ncbi:MAG: NAD(P)/FAD-dependent oxidoreductase [Bacteroidetes bacterium]|uniref:NAD(P)/FAD-dependent oxidoreductase n=1 Tax=Candidatus Cryptobacteroides merdavium TaxID=2840769 RepID=A0A9D9HB22_9BACT|nr:NAD(P)/FAD-dependent oxidoreductase [Candidatus Cryptobacteroides merdavium]
MEYSDIIIIGGGAAGLMAAIGAGKAFSGAVKTDKAKDADNSRSTDNTGDINTTGTKGHTIAVIEKMPRPGRKIMITGKGRCNITNMKSWNEFSGHIHPKANPLKPAFHNLNTEAVVRFFNDNGLETVLERGDRVFPASHLASDVVDTLVRTVSESGAQLHTGCEVSEIKYVTGNARYPESGSDDSYPGAENRTDDAGIFRIVCRSGREFTCRKLVIATGGLSYPGTGSTGDGYLWARQFGHTVSRCFPSLTAIVPEGYKISGESAPQNTKKTVNVMTASGNADGRQVKDSQMTPLKGHIDRSVPLSETGSLLNGNQLKNVTLTLIIDGNTVQEEFGDLDFTDGGIEGPTGFKVSRKCVNALINGSKATVSIDLKPAVDKEALDARIRNLWQEIANDRRSQGKKYEDRFRILLGKLIPMSLVQGFRRCNPTIDHTNLASRLKNWKMDIRGFVGYERCVITAGGVSTGEIISKTLESKLQPGLYFAGEILDLDGDTGGYNLQTAFSTGMLAGESAARSLVSGK